MKLDRRHETCAEMPAFQSIANGLTTIGRPRLLFSICLPFIWSGAYFVFAFRDEWLPAAFCLVALSFVTYGSLSHDLVHGNLGLRKPANHVLLSLIELMALRSGHAYRLAHLHHHSHFPNDDDVEARAAGMTFLGTLLEGIVFVPRIWIWALRNAKRDRWLIAAEGAACICIVVASVAMYAVTVVPLVYVVLMVMGSWVIPLTTSYIPHMADGNDELHQTRRFRGIVASCVAFEHLYHLEHHLYPAVPHHHWPELARRLDPYLDAASVKPVKFWF
jgi:beta-carotene hydroxylase